MNILITGGTGYLGSHLVAKLHKKNNIFILDKTKNASKIKNIKKNLVYYPGTVDKKNLKKIFRENIIDLVIHFAGVLKQKKNYKYNYSEDLASTKSLLKFIKFFKVKYFIYSSSCDVYGNVNVQKIKENQKCKPISSYGKNKLLTEKCIKEYLKDEKTKYLILRIFNIIGADINIVKENFLKKNDLLSNLISSYKNNKIFKLYGYDLKTDDGSCVRDYISIQKFVQIVKKLILKIHLINSSTINIGSSFGISNLGMINKVERNFKIKIVYKKLKKRKKDPTYLVANNLKVKKLLKLKNKFFKKDKIFKYFNKII
jgi:UDP-glucose 4-epimerase